MEKLIYTKNIIKKLIENNKFKDARKKIDSYKNKVNFDIDIYIISGLLYFIENKYEYALKDFKEAYFINPYNIDINFNLGYLYSLKGDTKNCEKHLLKALEVSEYDKNLIGEIKELIDDDILNNLKLKPIANNKLFPIMYEDKTWIGENISLDEKNVYTPCYYRTNIQDYPISLWNYYEIEIFKTLKIEKEYIKIRVDEDTIIPIAIMNGDFKISLNKTNISSIFKKINRYYYLRFSKGDLIEVEDVNNLIIGEPIKVKDRKSKINMVLTIFIDGLSQKFISEEGIENIMPNTFNFFSRGTIFENCHNNSEWTLSSFPSIFTGKYQINHKMFHPNINHFLNGDDLISTYFRNEGYFTFQKNQNWRITPTYGYVQGFNRTIYKSATTGSDIESVVMDFLENNRAFKERKQYNLLNIFDLHNISDDVDLDISSQVINGIDLVESDANKSVYSLYDNIKIKKYKNEIKRIDYYLGIIYSFIEKNYSNDEILVLLTSDHGQSFLDKGKCIFKDYRRKVPFMIRGRQIPSQKSLEKIENIDIFPTILNKSEIKFDESKIDGVLPISLGGQKEKKYLYSESIYPNKTYKSIIEYRGYKFYFESEGKVNNDGRFELGEYKLSLYNKSMDDDINIEKIRDEVYKIVLNHIKTLVKI